MNVLVLEDSRKRITWLNAQLSKGDTILWAQTAEQFAYYLEQCPSLVILDHDLGDGIPDTMAVLKTDLVKESWDAVAEFWHPTFWVWSQNTVGNENIARLLRDYGCEDASIVREAFSHGEHWTSSVQAILSRGRD